MEAVPCLYKITQIFCVIEPTEQANTKWRQLVLLTVLTVLTELGALTQREPEALCSAYSANCAINGNVSTIISTTTLL